MTTARAFRGFRFPAEVVLWAVRWYLRFPVTNLLRICLTPSAARCSLSPWKATNPVSGLM